MLYCSSEADLTIADMIADEARPATIMNLLFIYRLRLPIVALWFDHLLAIAGV